MKTKKLPKIAVIVLMAVAIAFAGCPGDPKLTECDEVCCPGQEHETACTCTADICNCTIENRAPTASVPADFGHDIADGAIRTINGSGEDLDGDNLTYTWSIVSGTLGTDFTIANLKAKNLEVTFLKAGVYKFYLTANDGKVDSAPSRTITVTVSDSRKPEINEIQITGGNFVGGKYRFDDTLTLGGNTAVDGHTYAWTSNPAGLTFGTPTAAGTTVSGFAKGGSYEVKLVITNTATSNTNEVKKVITIAGNQAPTIGSVTTSLGAGNTGTLTVTGLPVTLNGNDIADSDGGVTFHEWKCIAYDNNGHIVTGGTNAEIAAGIGVVGATANADVTLKKAGKYTFQLTVKDAEGADAVKSVVVTVEPFTAKADVNVAAVPFTVGSALKFKLDDGDNYSIVAGNDSALFDEDDLAGITYTLSSTNPEVDLSDYDNGNIPANEYGTTDYPTITQTFRYGGQVVGQRRVVVVMGNLGFEYLYRYYPADGFDTDWQDIEEIPDITLNNLQKEIAEVD